MRASNPRLHDAAFSSLRTQSENYIIWTKVLEHLHITLPGAFTASHSKSIGINMELVPPFAAITVYTLLGRLSTRFGSVSEENLLIHPEEHL